MPRYLKLAKGHEDQTSLKLGGKLLLIPMYFINADAGLFDTVTLGFLLEIFFIFGPRGSFEETSAGEEDNPIDLSVPFRLHFGELTSVRRSVCCFP